MFSKNLVYSMNGHLKRIICVNYGLNLKEHWDSTM